MKNTFYLCAVCTLLCCLLINSEIKSQPGSLNLTSTITDVTCGNANFSVPAICPCDGKMTNLTVQYNGPSGVDVEVYNKSDHSVLITSFSNVQNGDILPVSAANYNNGEFESTTWFQIVGGSQVDFHTSCSQDIQGSTQGDFTVVSFIDGSGQFCDADPICGCNGSMRNLTLRYNGPSGADLEVYNKSDHSILIDSYNNLQSGDVIFVDASSLSGGDFESTTWFQIVGGSEVNIHTSCSQDIQGLTVGNFTVLGYTDGAGVTCSSSSDCDGSIDLTVSGGTPPYSYQWSNGTIFEDLNNVCPGNYTVTVTDFSGNTIVSTYSVIEDPGTLSAMATSTAASCGSGNQTPPVLCDCNGSMTNLTVQYNGPSGVDVEVYNKSDHSILITSFTNVQNGDILPVSAASLSGGDFESTTWFQIVGGSQIDFHTSCSQDIQGSTQGDFTVVSFIDGSGQFCDAGPICDCDGGVSTMVLQYSGPNGATMEAYNSSNNNDLIDAFPNLQDGDILYLDGSGLSGGKFASSLYLQIVGGSEVDIHTSCSQDLQGVTFGNFTVIGFTDASGGVCESYLSCDGTADLTVTGGVTPYTYLWSDGSTSQDILDACPGNYSVTITDANGCAIVQTITVLEDPGTLAATVSSTNASCGAGNLPAPELCPCDGKMTELTLQYNGPNGVDVEVYNKDDHSVLITSFSNVKNGDLLPISAANYGDGDFESTTWIQVVGGAEVDFHTSCSQDIQGSTQGDFTVVSFVDGSGQFCDAGPICECDGKMTNLTLQYNGPNGADLEVYTKDDHNTLIESYNNLQDGDVIFVDASGLYGGDFESTTWFQIVGGNEINIHTSCSQDIRGMTYGNFTVLGYTDGAGVSCNSFTNCDGFADLSVTGGIPPYTYSWSNGATTEDLSDVCPGNYSVTITDANGCQNIQTITVEEDSSTISTTLTATDATCSSVIIDPPVLCPCNGGITDMSVIYNGMSGVDVLVTSGSNIADTIAVFPNVQNGQSLSFNGDSLSGGELKSNTYLWVDGANPISFHTSCSDDIQGTVEGNFTVESFTDANGKFCDEDPICPCDGRMTKLVVQYNGVPGADVEVYNKSDHSVLIASFTNVQPGEILYIDATTTAKGEFESNTFFQIVGGNEISIHTSCSDDIQGLVVGDFTVAGYTDGNGNECSDLQCDGSITVSVTGGIPPYSYIWSNGQDVKDLTNACPGDYTVTVTDVNGCEFIASASINEISGFTINVDAVNPSCEPDSCDGSIDVNVGGGTPPYSIIWSGPGMPVTQAALSSQISASSDDAEEFLDDGNSMFRTSDDLEMTKGESNVQLVGMRFRNIDICPGSIILGAHIEFIAKHNHGDVTNLNLFGEATDHSLTFSDVDGNMSTRPRTAANVSWSNIPVWSEDTMYASPDLGSIVQEIVNRSGWQYGNSLAIMVEGTGKRETYSWDEGKGTAPTLVINYLSSGLAGPYQDGLCAGSYTITIEDALGCSETITVDLTDPDPVTVNVTQDVPQICQFGTVNLMGNPMGGTGNYTHSWTASGGSFGTPDAPNTTYTMGMIGTHQIIYTLTDTNGCSASDTATVEVIGCGSIGDYVWCDDDGDGIQDPGEAPIAGVVIQLLDDMGNVIGTMTTDANGFYDFTNLPPGTYTVNVVDSTVPEGKQLTTANDPLTVNLGPGEDYNDADFGYQYTGSIGDYVWCDDNGDGIQDPGEAPIAGVVIQLLDDMGNVIGTMTTDANGFYDFTNLPPGTYTVNVVDSTVPEGKELTTANDPLTVNLGPGEDYNDADFGYQYVGSIGDYVWYDDNGDGVQDPTEAPIPGVVIQLLDDMGNVIGTMTTDANGGYDFTNLPPGNYTVNVVDSTVPDGYALTTANDPLMVNLGPGEDYNDADFGYQATGSIGDYVWCDDNGDGVQDPGEAPIAGVVIQLLDDMGNVIGTMTTDANGFYDFTNLPPGTYTVNVVDSTVPEGKELTTANDPLTVNLGPGEDYNDADFGYQYVGSIGDYVWYDDNGDGVQDPTEAPIPGVVIQLLDDMGNILGTMTTDSNGFYDFTNLPPGNYTVNVVDSTVPDGYLLTTANDPMIVNLGPGEDFNDADFGYQAAGSIGDYVWCDDNGDGIQDSNEAPIAGVVIQLLDDMGNVIGIATTDANGFYEFTGLPAGTYTVDVVDSTVPDGKVLTTGNDPLVVNLGRGEDFNDADFGYQYNGSIGDYVWCDDNGDGIQDPGEDPIEGVVIQLLDAMGNVIATMTTDANGAYDFTGLPPGTYTVNVVDSTTPDGKILTTGNDPLTVNLGPGEDYNDADFGYQCIPGSLTVIITPVSCFGEKSGAIDLTVVGGAGPPFTYLWSNGETTEDIDSIVAGTYSVTVTGASGCTYTDNFPVPQPDSLVGIATCTQVSCFGSEDGTASTTITGGTPPYIVNWFSSTEHLDTIPPDSLPMGTGLPPGSFIAYITDANGCLDTMACSITYPPPLVAFVSSTKTSCSDVCDGTATATIIGGNGVYSYLWDDPAGQTTMTATGLCPGLYRVVASDSNGCLCIDSVVVGQPNPLNTFILGTNVSVFGGSDGAADLTVSGGTPPYSYNWSNGATTQDLSGLTQGTYSVTVTDNNGCTATDQVIITEPISPTLCNVGEVGHVVCILGGSFPEEISWTLVNSTTGDTVASAACGTVPSGTSKDTVCLDDAGDYCFTAYDDWGDGWNGGSYAIIDLSNGATVISGSPNNGLPGDGSAGCNGSQLEETNCLTVGVIAGCTDSTAANYNPLANLDDGSCQFPGCTDPIALNFDSTANVDDGSCIYPVPVNDSCSQAITILCGDTVSGTTLGSTIDVVPTCGTSLSTAGGVWYVLTGDGNPVTASLCGSSYDTKIGVFENSCDSLVCVTGNDDDCGLQSQVVFNSANGTDYYIYVTGFGSNVGDYQLSITCAILGCTDPNATNYDPNATLDDGSCVFPPANDSCVNATAIACGDSVSGTTVGATADAVAPCGTSLNTAPGVWYVFNGNGDTVTASLCGSSYDTKIGVFSGSCDSLNCITGNDDDCGLQSEVTFTSTDGETYYILVTGFGSGAGDYSLALSCAGAPGLTNVTLLVDMCNETVDPAGVYVAGTFNGFDPTATQMTNIGGTVYSVTIQQAAGSFLQYKFLNGPSFAGEETVPAACGIDNGFGAFDRGFTVPASDTTAGLVAFGSCDTCIPPTNVTFIVNMCGELVDSAGVYVAGSFNGFDPTATQMTNIGGTTYSVTVALNAGQSHTYKYLNGPSYAGQETVPGACGQDDGFGAFNRTFTVPGSDTTLGPVRFGSCEEDCPACDAGQTAHVITITGGSFPSEISWSLVSSLTGDTAASSACGTVTAGTSTDTICLNDGENYCFNAYDDWGDGWNGGTYAISQLNSGAVVISGSPNNGAPGDGSAGCNGSQLEETTCLTVGVIEGCTNPIAVNYNPDATVDDGSCILPAPNDSCSDATAIACGDTATGTTAGGTIDNVSLCGTSLNTAPGVWYVFTGNGDTVTASLCGSSYDTKIGVFSGSCDSLNCITGNDDFCGLQSEVTFTSINGETYYILVTGFGLNVGDYSLALSCAPAAPIFGCTDPAAENYNPSATIDDGSCIYAVSFAVDMNCPDPDPGTIDTVFITGPFCSWCATGFPLADPDGDGIWEGTYNFPAGNLEYKYMVNNFVSQENLIDDMQGGASCAPVTDFFSFANRQITVPATTAVNETYGSCSPCPTGILGCTDPAALNYDSTATQDDGSCIYNVTFSVDMNCSGETFDTVSITGPFCGWCGSGFELSDPDNDGVYTGTFPFASPVEYKYIIDGFAGQENLIDDMVAGASCAPITDFFSFANRLISFGGDTAVDDNYGSCDDCVPGCTDSLALNYNPNANFDDGSCITTVNITLLVDMCNEVIDTAGVYVAGTFNGFDPTATQMTNIGGTVYTATVQQAPGSFIQYKFLNGPSFAGEETVPAACGIDNGFGAFDRGFTVPGADTTAGLVAFGSCDTCVPPTNVTFMVNMCGEVVDSQGVFLAGSFNGFSTTATPMTNTGGTTYSVTLALNAGQSHTYKYLNGPSFAGAELVPGACGQDDGFGAFNRTFTVPGSDTTLGPVRFGSCEEDCPFCPVGQSAHVISIAGGSFPAEIGWSLVNSVTGDTIASASCGGGGTFTDTVCLDDGGDYCFSAYDDWGDGWNGGTYAISQLDDGAVVISGSPDNGVDGDGTDVCDSSQLEETTCLTVGVIEGCTDSTALNYNPAATLDDGSCVFPPPNDLCVDAISVNCGDTVSGTTIGASADTIGTCGTPLNTAGGVWYVFAGDGSPVTASLCGSGFDTKIGVFSGTCSTLTCVAGNDDACGLQSEVTFSSVNGTDYYIYVTGFSSNVGNFDLSITCDILGCTNPAAINYDPAATVDDGSCVFPPANDSCANAISVACGDTVNGSTIGASPELGLPFCGTAVNTAPGVWYSFAGNGDTVTASLCGSGYDTKIGVFHGSCGALVCVGGSDDFCGLQSEVTFASMNGATYYIYVTGFGAAAGDFSLNVSCVTPVATCDVPENLNTQNITQTSAMLHWDAVPGAVVYRVRGDAVGVPFGSAALNALVSTNSLSFPGLNPGISYFWSVRAICDSAGSFVSDYAPIDTFTTNATCAVPQNLFTDSVTDNCALLNWDAVAGAIAYNIKGNSVGGNPVDEFNVMVAGTQFQLNNLNAGVSYWWTVQSICDLSGPVVSAFAQNDTFTTLMTMCNIPENLLSDSITDNCATLNWDPVPGALGYNIIGNAVGATTGQFSVVTTGTTFHLTGLNSGISYWWSVRSLCNVSGTIASPFATNDTFTTTIPFVCEVPQNLFTDSITDNCATLNWDTVPGAVAYRIKGNALGGDPINDFIVLIPSGSINTYHLTNLNPGVSYFWTVRAICDPVDPNLVSAFADPDTFTTGTMAACDVPQNLVADSITDNCAVFSWDAVQGAVGYELNADAVGVPADSAAFKLVLTTTSFDFGGLNMGITYWWTVRAICNVAGTNLSDFAPIDTFTTLSMICSVPANLATDSITNNSALLTWDAVPEAIAYTVKGNAVGGNPVDEFNMSTTNTSFMLSGLNPTVSYWWTVASICDLTGTQSPFATADTFATLTADMCDQPAVIQSSNVTSSGALLQWTPVTGAFGYIVRGNAVGITGGEIVTQVITSNQLLVSDMLMPGVSYWWQVRTVCDASLTEFSSYTDRDTFTTILCNAPTSLSTTMITATSARLNWTPVPGASGYNICGRPQGGGTIVCLTVAGGNTSFKDVGGLMSGMTFEWSIQAVCGSEMSSFAPISSFTTPFVLPKVGEGSGDASTFGGAMPAIDMTVYPNPNEGQFNIELFNLTDKDANVVIYDLLGKIVHTETVKSENQQALLNVKLVEAGTYMIQVMTDSGNSLTRRVVVQ